MCKGHQPKQTRNFYRAVSIGSSSRIQELKGVLVNGLILLMTVRSLRIDQMMRASDYLLWSCCHVFVGLGPGEWALGSVS